MAGALRRTALDPTAGHGAKRSGRPNGMRALRALPRARPVRPAVTADPGTAAVPPVMREGPHRDGAGLPWFSLSKRKLYGAASSLPVV